MSDKQQKRQSRIADLTVKYWKKWDYRWNLLSIVAVGAALLENLLVPAQELVNNTVYRYFLVLYGLYLIGIYLYGRFVSFKAHFYAGHFAQLNTVLGILLIAQDLLTEKFARFALPFFVSFAQILDQISEDHQLLWESTESSLGLWLISFIIGTLVGVSLGLAMGRYRQANYWAFPFLKVIGIIPAAAWMPLTMILFPTSYSAEVFLIVFSVWFPVAFMTIGGVQGIPTAYFESAHTLGFSEWRIIRKVVIPGTMPSIFIGMYTALGLSFMTLVISEMMGAKVGLGWYINWAKGTGNYTQVYASIAIMALLFSIIFSLLTTVQEKVLRWRNNSTGI